MMEVTIKIQSPDDLRKLMAFFEDAPAEDAPAPAAKPKPKPAQKPPLAKPQPAPEVVTSQSEPVDQAAELLDDAPAVTLDAIRSQVRIVIDAKGLDAAKAVFAEYGAAKVSDLPESKYAEIMAKLKAAVA